MCLEITYPAIPRYPENFSDALNPGQNEKSYIFEELRKLRINV